MTESHLLDPRIERLTAGELRTLQNEKWATQWKYVSDHSAFYRRKLDGWLARTVSLDGLQDLPLTDKDELRRAQEVDYPFGDYLACPTEQVVRIHRTSGTTGRALILANSARDVGITARLGGRSLYAAGLRPADRVVHCLNYCLWTGGVTDHLALEATGAAVIPFGTGSSRELIDTITDLGVSAISCTPSYPALLEQVLENQLGRSPRDLGLRLALFGGEAGLDNEDFRRGLEDRWGFGVRNANFGMSEVLSILASQCEETTDLHFNAGDTIFVELLDLDSGRRLEIADGVTGELVCTHLEKECQPLVRYRTRDVITVTGAEVCGCGRTSFRFRVSGRTDDMFNVRGINVFPTAVQRILAGSSDLTSGHFRIVLEGPGPYDRIHIRAEAAPGSAPDQWTAAARALEEKLRTAIGASARVELLPFETFPRTSGKTSTIERI